MMYWPSCPRSSALALALTFAISLAACSSTPSAPPVGRELVTGLVDTVYVPTLEALARDMPALVTATDALCAAPTEVPRLEAARDAWRAVRRPWKQLEAGALGPVIALRIDAELDFWPARVEDIVDELDRVTPTVVDDAYVAGLGATRKGLPVIEYVLFAAPERLAGASGARTCSYVQALARRSAAQATVLADAWRATGGNFRSELVEAGRGSTMYMTVGEAINATGNALIIAIENAEGVKLAKPLGRRDGGTPQPEAVESRFADNARADLLDTLAGARAVYTSTYGGTTSAASFSSFIRSRDSALDDEVLAELAACESIVTSWSQPLDVLVVTSPDPAIAAFDCTKQLLGLLKADVASLLGVTPTFGDVDGD